MKKLYFAYGSNMSQSRLETRVGKVNKVLTIKLDGYKLVFNAGVGKRFANLQMTGDVDDVVEGVVYSLSDRQEMILDAYEGFPMLYQKVIVRNTLDYCLYTYISINPLYTMEENTLPERKYLKYIYNGCKENNFTATYDLVRKLFPKK